MKVVITSDSHGQTDFIKKLAFIHQDANLFLDCGDSCKSENELKPFLTVKGNCDFYNHPRYRIINLGENKIYLFHGDRYFLTDDLLARLSKDNNCNIIIHGHTHIRKFVVYDNVYILCPGSISIPRGGNPSYIVLEISDLNQIKVSFKEYGY